MTEAADYSIGDASEQSGLSPRQIRYLEERGLIRPEYIEVHGIRQRRYSPELVKRLAEITRLRDGGFTLDAAVAQTSVK